MNIGDLILTSAFSMKVVFGSEGSFIIEGAFLEFRGGNCLRGEKAGRVGFGKKWPRAEKPAEPGKAEHRAHGVGGTNF